MDKNKSVDDKGNYLKSNTNVFFLLLGLIILFGYTINHLLNNYYKINNDLYLGWIYSIISIVVLLIYAFGNDRIHKKNLKDFHFLSVSLLSFFGFASLYFGIILILNAPAFYESYDVIILGLFCLYMAYFLYKGKDKLGKDGLLLLYREKWGIKFIEKIGSKYKRTFTFFSYVSIICGFILMAGAIYMLWTVIEVYLFRPDVIRAIKVPPITPLIPYLPKIFKIDFLPPFYVSYWIVIIAIAAIPHEFFHGIFMRRYNIHIKSTGFGFFPWFLPVFLAAFVEQDEKSMEKASKFEQMAVLAAGTFANVLTGIFFFFVFWIFFILFFHPAGIVISDYSSSSVKISDITMINGVSVDNPDINRFNELVRNGTNEIVSKNENYVGIKSYYTNTDEYVLLYDDTPAIKSNLTGAITEINDVKIANAKELTSELEKYKSGDKIKIKIINKERIIEEKEITLGENPVTKKAFLGIALPNSDARGIKKWIYNAITIFKKPEIYYKPVFNGLSIFIYNLLLWILLVCVSIAFVNMLPVGIFDGGRFFYLTVWGITGNEKIAKRAFSFVTYLFLAFLALIMMLWFVAIYGKYFKGFFS
ncbi:hypothetical protein COU57_02085 [Candidatus Pacearchaeota archaeon CG10_big_fil_rev_8_21_14_0_10_32_14]|nr:MAG: hypothetical protein COU57_02085 [Candidatus Pacearchaeota archaeon CG10_big_fil_rev_8_21_14_0_10_32_14]